MSAVNRASAFGVAALIAVGPWVAGGVGFPLVRTTEVNLSCSNPRATVEVKRLRGDEGTFVRLVRVGLTGTVDSAFLPTDGSLTLQDPTALPPGTAGTYRIEIERLGKVETVARLVISNYVCSEPAP